MTNGILVTGGAGFTGSHHVRTPRDRPHVDDHVQGVEPVRTKRRAGEVRNIGGGTESTSEDFATGLAKTVTWYRENRARREPLKEHAALQCRNPILRTANRQRTDYPALLHVRKGSAR